MSTPYGFHRRNEPGLRGWLARRWVNYRTARICRALERHWQR